MTSVKLFKGVPLVESGEHTMFFNNLGEQLSYFNNFTPLFIDSINYQREQGYIQVPYLSDDLQPYNYLSFVNNLKTYFAFITDIEYKTDRTSRITFKIDELQTWFFEMQINPCFVEREHTISDNLYEHTLPESVETGEYITTASKDHYRLETLYTWGCFSEKIEVPAGEIPIPYTDLSIATGLPIGGLNFVYFGDAQSTSTVTIMNRVLSQYSREGKEGAVVAIFTAFSPNPDQYAFYDTSRLVDNTPPITPKNNKLYSSPYSNCVLSSSQGQAVVLNYEQMDASQLIEMFATFGLSPQFSALPRNYSGDVKSYDNMVNISALPVLPWINNYYENYTAQTKTSRLVSFIGGAASIVGGLATAALTGGIAAGVGIAAAVSGFGLIANAMATQKEQQIVPDTLQGSANAAETLAVTENLVIYSKCRTVKAEYARLIDDYFSMYGYKINELKKPTLRNRQNWTFIKTIGSNITGAIPKKAQTEINSIFDKGVTFWVNDLGNYERGNSVL